MNRCIAVLLASVSTGVVSFGAVTNFVYTGTGTQTTNLVNNQYVGVVANNIARSSAAITNVAAVSVSGSSFTGASAQTTSSAAAITRDGGAGLRLSNIDLATINNQAVEAEAIRGGKGGDVTMTALASPVSVNGGSGIAFGGVGATDKLTVNNALVMGGNGGRISSASFAVSQASANGGAAVNVQDGAVDINAGSFTGGAGGAIQSSASSTADALGGHGLELGGAFTLDPLTGTAGFFGGTGGSITNNSGRAKASGGNGVHVFSDFAPKNFEIGSGTYVGGNGGVARFNSTEIATPYEVSNLEINGARGGHGVRISRADQIPNGSTLAINGGMFAGGNGGTAVNLAAGSVTAQGGSGLFVDYMDNITINGGTFVGGQAGSANGIKGISGAGAHFQDSNVEINGGAFLGEVGLRVVARYYPVATTINTGTFSHAEFTALDDGSFPGFVGENTVNILGGSFTNLLFNGNTTNNASISGGNVARIEVSGSADNNVVVTGANVGNVVFSGTGTHDMTLSAAGTTNISFTGSANSVLNIANNGSAIQTIGQDGGTAKVVFGSAHTVDNITVANGTLNLSGSALAVSAGNAYRLGSLGARLNVANALSINSGGTLDVDLGEVSATTFTAKGGSQLRTRYGDVGGVLTNGLIRGNNLTFEQGATWTLYGSSTNSLSDFLLATATNSISQNLAVSDIVLEGNTDWISGINGVTNRTINGLDNLYATYGQLDLSVALDAEGEFKKALDDLDRVGAGNTLQALFNSQAEADFNLENGYVRTPEMANTLIGLQSVFADQVKDRTRSYLRLQTFGSNGSVPQGAAGPSDWYDTSVQWLNDHLPSWDLRGSARTLSDQAPMPPLKGEPSEVGKPYVTGSRDSEYKAVAEYVNEKAPRAPADFEVPTTYQVWGRGYGSRLEQKSSSDHVGYEATVAGGMVGMDKRFDNLLAGLGVGYASTTLDGNAGNDAEAVTGHAVAYLAAQGETCYFDANLNYALNAVETEGIKSLGYTGEYNAQTVGFYLGGGLAFAALKDSLLFTPEASLLSTYYNREDYTETSSLALPAKDYDSYDQWSFLSSLGATLSMIHQIENFNTELEFQPELRAHWLHEFNAEMDNETYTMVGGVNNIGVSLQAREEDLMKIGGGLRFSKWQSDTTEFGIDLDGVFGSDYTAYILSGKIMHRF